MSAPEERARLWPCPAFRGLTLLAATFRNFSFSRHVHPEYAIGVIEKGAERFHYAGKEHVAPAGSLLALDPDVPHNGMSAAPEGFRYRMAYLPRELAIDLSPPHADTRNDRPSFNGPVIRDPALARRLHRAMVMLDAPEGGGMAAQEAFISVVTDLFHRHARPFPDERTRDHAAALARARDFIHDRSAEPITLEDIAGAAGLSRFHLIRRFKALFGLSPHEYLVQRRLDMARHLIADGAELARAAAEAGFSDQSHLTRLFKSAFGLPPGRFRRMAGPGRNFLQNTGRRP